MLKWCYAGHQFTDTIHILDIGEYDAILGNDWLDRCGLVMCHLALKRLQFKLNVEQEILQGLDTPSRTELYEITVTQLQTMFATNEVGQSVHYTAS
jgi:hypothetical protein